ncbi:MAG: lytic transglycosylase domain-containing protein [Elusimicrobiota bacterium]
MRRLVSFILIIFLTLPVSSYSASYEWDWEHDLWVEQLAKKYGIQASLIKGLIKAESNFKFTESSKGAVGFMQVKPETARSVGIPDVNDPVQNIKAGVKFLNILLERFNNNIPLALAAYNAGPGAVEKHNGIPPYPETCNFVFKVLRFRKEFESGRKKNNYIF